MKASPNAMGRTHIKRVIEDKSKAGVGKEGEKERHFGQRSSVKIALETSPDRYRLGKRCRMIRHTAGKLCWSHGVEVPVPWEENSFKQQGTTACQKLPRTVISMS